MSIADLKPEPITIRIKNTTLEAKPPRLADALIMTKVGKIFENPENATDEQIEQAQASIDKVIAKLIPEVKDTELDLNTTMEILTQLLSGVEPEESKELRESGVQFDDPKAEKIG
jgi:hypothetical protein